MEMRAATNYINAGHYREALNVLERMQEKMENGIIIMPLQVPSGKYSKCYGGCQNSDGVEPGNLMYQRLYQQPQSSGTMVSEYEQFRIRPIRNQEKVYGGNWCCKCLCMNMLCPGCCCMPC